MSGGGPTFVTDLAMVAGVAAVTGVAARALGQPTILGYLLAGLIVGPSIPIPLFADPHRIEALAEFGVVLVMFAVGLEFRVARLLRVVPVSGFTALVQVAALGWVGFTLGSALGWGSLGGAFLGAALAISSTMVVTGIFAQQPVDEGVREHVLGVLVVQDLVAIVLIAVMTAVSAGQSVAPADLGWLLVRLGGVLLGMLALGMLVVPRLTRRVAARGGVEGLAVLAVGLAFGFAVVAQSFGYSVALGAFVAGILAAESGVSEAIEHAIEPLRAVFAAVFFVSIGMAVDPMVALESLPLALLISAAVILAQLISVSVASLLSGSALRRSVLSGLALGQIGELSFILAGIGIAGGAAPATLLPTLVTVATITAFTTPLLLRRGDGLVRALDRGMPPRLQHLLAVQQGFVARLRAGGREAAPLRRAATLVVVDWLALVALAAVALTLQDQAGTWLAHRAGLEPDVAALVVDGAGLAAALPLLVGLVRNTRLLARLAARATDLSIRGETPQVVARLLEAMAGLVLVVGVVLPALALLRPLARGPWGEPLVLGALAASVVWVWRNLGAMEGAYVSGAGELARRLASQAGAEPAAVHEPALLPGLDRALALPLGEGAHAVGRTLAEVDLRARTGASVVAIRKGDAEVVLPTGHERLAPGDVLALVGTDPSVERARTLLVEGPDAAEVAQPPLET